MIEKKEIKYIVNKEVLPAIALRSMVLFPGTVIHFDVARQKSILALEDAMANDQKVFLIAQKDGNIEDPSESDLFETGSVAVIKQLLKLPGDSVRVLVEGVKRAKVCDFVKADPYFVCEIAEKEVFEENVDPAEREAYHRNLSELYEEYFTLSGKLAPEMLDSVLATDDVSRLSDLIASNVMMKFEDKQKLLSEFDVFERATALCAILKSEISILGVEKKIAMKVREQVDENQKEYFLREQLKAIENELGEKDGTSAEIAEYKKKIKKLKLPQEANEKLENELKRLSKTNPQSPEGGVIRTYLDWICELPWNTSTKDNFDLEHAREILERDHYGLEKVKDRILEFLAVKQMANDIKGPVLCFVGPPGVGKTSIAKSIAEALGKKYVRLSLGGVRDEAEIRGHRKTYIGSMPGRIINAVKTAGTNNPLILLDEIDKMSNDFRGDPASAMLEVLDGEQNFAFRDHYIELPFDLSKVMFVTTANTLETIPRPLLDRMEVIELSTYTEEEKFHIATKYLIPKQKKLHGLKGKSLKITDEAVKSIISYYTREAGVRNLERAIANICRKTAKLIVTENRKTVTVSEKKLEQFLGGKRYSFEKIKDSNEVGVATGRAWTAVGGDTLSNEVNIMSGSGKVELTGHLGDVMKESAMAALSYIRSRVTQYNIDEDFYKKYDIHIHVPEGAVPKDGPSAGITIATALLSALSQNPVRRDVAMTGEITLRGRVLPIGGLKEKTLAAYRAGIYNIIIPFDNQKDTEEIPDSVKKELRIYPVKTMDEVAKIALLHQVEQGPSPELYLHNAPVHGNYMQQ